MLRTKILSGLFAVCTAWVATGSYAVAQEKSQLDTVLERGKVIVGVSSESPPFGFVNEKGELVGFDIDIAKLVARSLFGGKENKELVKKPLSTRREHVKNGNKKGKSSSWKEMIRTCRIQWAL